MFMNFRGVTDFSAARNFSFSKATMDYTMWLDADDYLSEKIRFQLQKLKETLSTDMAFLRYDVAFDAQGNPTLSYYRERIVRTSLKYHWTGEIHEIIVPQGSIGYFDIHIEHRKLHPTEKGRNLRSHGQYRTAAFWYETAAASNPAPQNGGFFLIDCYRYIPCMQLCVCYDHLGEREKAETWNEKAGAQSQMIRPTSITAPILPHKKRGLTEIFMKSSLCPSPVSCHHLVQPTNRLSIHLLAGKPVSDIIL